MIFIASNMNEKFIKLTQLMTVRMQLIFFMFFLVFLSIHAKITFNYSTFNSCIVIWISWGSLAWKMPTPMHTIVALNIFFITTFGACHSCVVNYWLHNQSSFLSLPLLHYKLMSVMKLRTISINLSSDSRLSLPPRVKFHGKACREVKWDWYRKKFFKSFLIFFWLWSMI